MSGLVVENRFPDPDAAYAAIVEAHEGLDETASAALDARLVLVLANQIGDLDVLRAAIALAKSGDDGMSRTRRKAL